MSDGLDMLALDGHGLVEEQARIEGQSSEPKCPMGYDADTVKVGPLTCLVCKSLLFKTVRVMPCRHLFCNSCCLRLGSCGLCGGESTALEQDDETRMLDQNVRYFVEKYARRKRKVPQNAAKVVAEKSEQEGANGDSKNGDLSLEQGGLLLQLAMRVRSQTHLSMYFKSCFVTVSCLWYIVWLFSWFSGLTPPTQHFVNLLYIKSRG